jgi:hypothetical protein
VVTLYKYPEARIISVGFWLATAYQCYSVLISALACFRGVDQGTLYPPSVTDSTDSILLSFLFTSCDTFHYINTALYGPVVGLFLGWPALFNCLAFIVTFPYAATLGHPGYLTDAGLEAARWMGRRVVPENASVVAATRQY